MSTLRQKVDQFCVATGTTNASSLRIAKLEEDLKKAKDDLKTYKKDVKFQQEQTRKAAKQAAPKAKTQRVKMTDEEKAQRRRERAVAKELAIAQKRTAAPAEPMMPAPIAAPSLAPAASKIKKGGRGKTRRMKRPVMRW
jgi:hypothetical protein